jgi:hypothetical protein
MIKNPFPGILIAGLLLSVSLAQCGTENKDDTPQWNERIQAVLDNTVPLEYDRGNRLPLYLWTLDPGQMDEAQAEILVREMDSRGVGIVCTWKPDEREQTLNACLTVARAQKKLGKRVNINANPLLYSLFNGDEETAHINEKGEPFFDEYFPSKRSMGCPFAIDHRKHEIRERVEYYVNGYEKEGIPVDFVVGDWEIDGPLDVNRTYQASMNCTRCRAHLGETFSYADFQKTMREMRSYLQYYMYSSPVLSAYPDALVGNYAVYPNDGYRYWYDYFEYHVEGQPYKADQDAKYRVWYNDYPATGYTYAMPVVYTWYTIFDEYDFDNPDYRWFYNMLLVASNAGKSTPQNIPIVSFVTWNTVWVSHDQKSMEPDPAVKQMSSESYQELLWHMLLRGTDTFFLYFSKRNIAGEVRLVHEVYAEAQKYGDFLEHGLPITYDVPDEPGTVVSGLILDDRVLVRRSDFGTNREPVELMAGTKLIRVDYAPGICQVIELD